MTIYALSTARGRAGVAIIRVSGVHAARAVEHLTRRSLPPPRRASLRWLFDSNGQDRIDRALVLWFPGPASFTGEDMAEFHVHSSAAVLNATFEALAAAGLRMAEPGEFTKRAFENGKCDLTEAEGLVDLINAQTAHQRRQALNQASGVLRLTFEDWRTRMLTVMAYVEATLDFPEEGDIAADVLPKALVEAEKLMGALESAMAKSHGGEILRNGIKVAIVGPPNAGKSSLLNAIAAREAAIVHDEPGTTRDVMEIAMDMQGFPFRFYDTAGVRETESWVEREGIRRGTQAAREADVIVVVEDATREADTMCWVQATKGEPANDAGAAQVVLTAVNKVDLTPAREPGPHQIPISAKTGEGLDALRAVLVHFAETHCGADGSPILTRARHRQEVSRAKDALQRFVAGAHLYEEGEILAEHLREAANALGRLTGQLDVEDVLGQLFAEFCIGK